MVWRWKRAALTHTIHSSYPNCISLCTSLKQVPYGVFWPSEVFSANFSKNASQHMMWAQKVIPI